LIGIDHLLWELEQNGLLLGGTALGLQLMMGCGLF